MDTWAIIPVKSLQQSKGRLAHLLPPGSRAQLVRNLLNYVLATVLESPGITRVLVISSDPEVREIAAASGATAIVERPPYDLNNAVAYAYALAERGGAEAALILPADLPLVTTADIELMIAAGLTEGSGNGSNARMAMGPAVSALGPAPPVMAICSDRCGDGTNALFIRPALDFDFHYGPSSLQQHIREAIDRDFLVRLVNAPGLQFDLDTEQDWQTFQEDVQDELVKRSPLYPIIN